MKKMDWLSLETRIRQVFSKLENKEVRPVGNNTPATLALHDIATIIGDETGRGYPDDNLNDDYLNQKE